jgi:hypothetical protein
MSSPLEVQVLKTGRCPDGENLRCVRADVCLSPRAALDLHAIKRSSGSFQNNGVEAMAGIRVSFCYARSEMAGIRGG